MPYQKLNVTQMIQEKRQSRLFDQHYKEVEKEYELIQRVVDIRKERGITQKSLAEMAGITQQEISRFENEKHIPKLTSFIRILDALNLEIRLETKQTP